MDEAAEAQNEAGLGIWITAGMVALILVFGRAMAGKPSRKQ